MANSGDLIELSQKIYQKVLREVTEANAENKLNEILVKYGLVDEIEYPCYDINMVLSSLSGFQQDLYYVDYPLKKP